MVSNVTWSDVELLLLLMVVLSNKLNVELIAVVMLLNAEIVEMVELEIVNEVLPRLLKLAADSVVVGSVVVAVVSVVKENGMETVELKSILKKNKPSQEIRKLEFPFF